MRRFILAAIVLALHAAPLARSPQLPAATDDGIARLLLGLERAIGAGRAEDFAALAVRSVPAGATNRFALAAAGGPGAQATVRERMRRARGAGYDVVADVLVGRDVRGRLATWLITATPDPAAADRFLVADLRELASVDGLLKLRLDTSRQFAVKNLVINAPDLAMTMASGTAFLAASPGGVTGLVLRGRGELLFSPRDPAEQLQLRIFSRRTTFRTDVDTIFMRVSPAEFAERVLSQSLTPVAVNPTEAARAQEIFDEHAPKTYTLDLRSLSSERWSLEPGYGNLVVEFRTSRHGWLTYARSPSDREDISLFERATHHYICQYTSNAQAGRARVYSDDDGATYDVEHYGLDLAIDPARLWIGGRGSVRLRILAESASTVTLRLAQALNVSSASSPEMGELLAVRIVGQNHLLIGLPEPVARGSSLTIDVTYAGRLPPQLIDREAMAPQAQGLDRPVQVEDLIVTPEPRFVYSNRGAWYPQGLSSDYATADLRLSVPAEFQIVATGRLTASAESPVPAGLGRPGLTALRTVEFVADRPVRYLSCLISRFSPIGQSIVDVPAVAPAANALGLDPPKTVGIEVMATARMVTRNRQTVARTADVFQFYATLMGEAPYPKLTLIALDDNLPGGHSPAYFVTLHQALPTTPYSWSSDPVAFDNQYPPFFLAHEVAHQWWGQAVGWRNYHEHWLSEGLAQYFAVLYATHDRGPAMLTSLIETMRATSEPVISQGPISLGFRLGHIKNDGRIFRNLVYNKSAVVLHMLRRFIGDEAFFAGLRRYYTDWRFRKAGTDNLQAAFEAGTPLDLGRFFDGWIHGFAKPRVRVTSRVEDDGQTSVIRVEQRGEVFDFPLDVVVQFADGRSETRTLRVVGQDFEERVTANAPIRRVSIRDTLSYFDTY